MLTLLQSYLRLSLNKNSNIGGDPSCDQTQPKVNAKFWTLQDVSAPDWGIQNKKFDFNVFYCATDVIELQSQTLRQQSNG